MSKAKITKQKPTKEAKNTWNEIKDWEKRISLTHYNHPAKNM